MPAKLSDVWSAVLHTAIEQGVLVIGASPVTASHVEVFDTWLRHRFDAETSYLRRNRDARADPLSRFPWVRSAIVIAVAYPSERPSARSSIAAHIARYALGDDYHDILDSILRAIESTVVGAAPGAITRRYVDTGPLSDRALAQQAGLGWIGKNAMLIHPDHGSWFVIGVLLTSLETDLPVREIMDQCGGCTRCLDTCPTGAIVEGRMVDSRRCLSWATIEHRGAIPDDLADRLEGNLFGCDICQEVCPWNEQTPPSHPALAPRATYATSPIHALLRMTQHDFSALFRRSAVKRAKRAGLIRNAILLSRDLTRDVVETLEQEDDDGISAALDRRMP